MLTVSRDKCQTVIYMDQRFFCMPNTECGLKKSNISLLSQYHYLEGYKYSIEVLDYYCSHVHIRIMFSSPDLLSSGRDELWLILTLPEARSGKKS